MLKFLNIKRLFERSFLIRTFLATSACIFIVTVGLIMLFTRSQMRTQEEILIEKGRLLSKILANNSRIGIFSDDPALLENPVGSVAGLKEVIRISVWDFEKKCLIQFDKKGFTTRPDKSEKTENGFEACMSKIEIYQSVAGDNVIFWAPVIISRTQKGNSGEYSGRQNEVDVIGAVEVIMDRRGMWAEWRRTILSGSMVGVLALMICGAIAYVLAIGVTNPLKRLKDNVELYSREGVTTWFHSGRKDEIGALADSFNEMVLKLDTRDIALKKANEVLEKKVEARTAELVEMNSQLNAEIQERYEIQKALRESELLYRGIFTASTDAFFICDNNIMLQDVNPAGCILYGYSRKEFLELGVEDLVHPDENDFVPRIRKALDDNGAFFSESLHLTSDGSPLHTEFRAVKYLTDDIERVFITVRNISENKALQTKLIHSERLVATGRLAASVAHEINSPLQGITAILSDIKEQCAEDQLMTADLSLVKEAFGSIRNIVRKLLDLNRPDGEKTLVDIHGVIEGTLRLVKSYLLKNRVIVNYWPCTDLPVLSGSSQQLGQCFMNIINNSVEAMGKESEDSAVSREITIRTHIDKLNRVINVVVTDTGPGIDESELDLLFEPFYTRNKKSGMGIGLAVCQQIIREHNGSIVAGNTGSGARFAVTLPLGKI